MVDRVLLLGLEAGGTGLNLVAADTVLLCDGWWNPAVEAQAIDRVHRVGQHRPVFVYRMIATDTVEDKMEILKRRKADLVNSLWEMVDNATDANVEVGAPASSGEDIGTRFEARPRERRGNVGERSVTRPVAEPDQRNELEPVIVGKLHPPDRSARRIPSFSAPPMTRHGQTIAVNVLETQHPKSAGSDSGNY